MNINVHFETLGCPKNQVDSEVMIGIMEGNSFYVTHDALEAEVIVVNTCGFIESAKEESISTILELLEYKKVGKCKYFIVAGCLVERYSADLKKEIPEIDGFIGTTQFENIFEIVNDLMSGTERGIVRVGDIDKNLREDVPRILTTPSYFAYLKISEGCDNKCTYCIIPQLRGKYRSRERDIILKEAKLLASQGVKEIIVIAQDTTRYGIDLYGDYELYKLLEDLNDVEGIEWIRLQYCYPDVIDERLIHAIATLPKVAKYIDMPIQHASNSVLKRMNRRTSQEQIRQVVTDLRAKCPSIAIRTTIIVGFPGETEEEYNELVDFVKEMKFEKLGVFAYSLEENTAAAKMDNHLEEDIKEERKNNLLGVQQSISESICYGKVGSQVDVLVEELVPDENIYIGRSQYDAPEIDGVVYVHTDEKLKIGSIYTVKITDALEYDLIGEY
jgi:ribosomal protein S12 methylthiotransferase